MSSSLGAKFKMAMEWGCLDSRHLCLPVAQSGYPNYPLVRGWQNKARDLTAQCAF